MTNQPSRTSKWVLERLEEAEDRHHRSEVRRLAGLPPRVACERHGWSPEGGVRTNNWAAVASLCPYCREARRKAEREAAAPEVRHIDFGALPPGSLAARLWDEAREAQAKAGIIVAGSPEEREILRTLDAERDDEEYELRQSAQDRRRSHEDHWRRRYGGRSRAQQYVPHPARAGS